MQPKPRRNGPLGPSTNPRSLAWHPHTTTVYLVRILISVAFLILGISLAVFGISEIADGSNGAGPLAIGIPFTLLAALAIRKMNSSSVDTTFTPPSSIGEHSLTEHHDRLAHLEVGHLTTAPSSTPPTPARPNRAFKLAIFVGLLIAGAGVLLAVAVEESSRPNVPVHVLDACHDALSEAEGVSASYGEAVTYDPASATASAVGFETSQGWTWTCTFDNATGDASASTVNRG